MKNYGSLPLSSMLIHLVQHADTLSPPELCPVTPYIIELVLVISCLLVDQENALADPVGLARLYTQY